VKVKSGPGQQKLLRACSTLQMHSHLRASMLLGACDVLDRMSQSSSADLGHPQAVALQT
jgi:hypothetical protein